MIYWDSLGGPKKRFVRYILCIPLPQKNVSAGLFDIFNTKYSRKHVGSNAGVRDLSDLFPVVDSLTHGSKQLYVAREQLSAFWNFPFVALAYLTWKTLGILEFGLMVMYL